MSRRRRRHDLFQCGVGAAWLTPSGRPGRCWCTAAPSGYMARPHGLRSPRTSRACGEYGTGKAAIEALLHRRSRAGCRAWCHPGHISGPGWPVITPATATRTQTSGGGWPPANRSFCPNLGLGVMPCPRGRRCSGLRTGADSFSRDRVELPRGLRAGHDRCADWPRGCRIVPDASHSRARRLAGIRTAGRRRACRCYPRPRRRSIAASIGGPATSSGTPRYSSLDALHRVASLARGQRPRRRRWPRLQVPAER